MTTETHDPSKFMKRIAAASELIDPVTRIARQAAAEAEFCVEAAAVEVGEKTTFDLAMWLQRNRRRMSGPASIDADARWYVLVETGR